MISRRFVTWALVADVVPLYPLYALLFADTGLSEAEISALFALWSAVGILAEVPSGAVADRWSRRGCLVAGAVLQATGFVLWLVAPGFVAFAAGFVLWGLGGALVSGAQEALLYDALAACGESGRYVRVQGRIAAAGLVAQLPAAGAATVLYAWGGYALVGWVSVGVCLVAAALALRLPEAPRIEEDGDNYFVTLRAGVVEAATRPGLRGVLVAAAVVGGLDAIDEYFPLITADAGVATDAVALAMLPIVLLGTAGAALAERASRLRPIALTAVLAASLIVLAAGVRLPAPWGIAAVAGFYGLYRAVLVVVDARLQERIAGDARATVTSVAGLGVEVAGLGVFAAWALGGGTAVAAVWLGAALALPRLLRPGVTPRPTR